MTDSAADAPEEIYESFLGPILFTPAAKDLLRRAKVTVGESVLDAACGTGRVTRQLVPLVGPTGYLAAFDFSPAMLEVAQASPELVGADVDWREADASELPFSDGTFDLVVCQHSLQFFPDRPTAVSEVRRVLKTGGRYAVSTWQGLDHQPTQGPLRRAFSRHFGIPESAAAPPWSLGNADELRSLLEDSGFSDVVVVVHQFQANYPSAATWVEQQFNVAAATMPAYAEIGDAERDQGIIAIDEEMATILSPYITESGGLSAPEPMIVAIAYA